MDHTKFVLKSKSSNANMTTKVSRSPVGRRHKKSRSSAEFQETSLKKRGVYVEKKSTSELYHGGADRKSRRAVRRSRRDNKGFLNSILNLLCQDTISTQFPDMEARRQSRRVKKRFNVTTADKSIQDLDRLPSPGPENKEISPQRPAITNSRVSNRSRPGSPGSRNKIKRSNKSSKIINALDEEDSKFELLAKKNVTEENSLPGRDIVIQAAQDTPKQVHLDLPKVSCPLENQEEKKSKKSLLVTTTHEEPSTLMSEYKEKDSFYEFFVNILQSTCGTQKEKPPGDKLEIDETVAKKLNLNEDNELNEDCSCLHYKSKITRTPPPSLRGKDSKIFQIFRDESFSKENIKVYRPRPNWANMNPPIVKFPQYKQRSFTRNMLTEQEYKPMRTETKTTTEHSVYDWRQSKGDQKRKGAIRKKKNKKQELLSILKEQLRMEDDAFDEPQTMHQALKIIARNKRRCRKFVRLVDSVPDCQAKSKSNMNVARPCIFKRRKVISPSNYSNKRNPFFKIYNPQTAFNTTIRTSAIPRKFSFTTNINTSTQNYNLDENMPYMELSSHSLEVQDFPNETQTKDDRMKQEEISRAQTPLSKRISFTRYTATHQKLTRKLSFQKAGGASTTTLSESYHSLQFDISDDGYNGNYEDIDRLLKLNNMDLY